MNFTRKEGALCFSIKTAMEWIRNQQAFSQSISSLASKLGSVPDDPKEF